MTSIWSRLTLDEVQQIFGNSERLWWMAGGVAIDIYLQSETRLHEDIDIIIRREDQKYFQDF